MNQPYPFFSAISYWWYFFLHNCSRSGCLKHVKYNIRHFSHSEKFHVKIFSLHIKHIMAHFEAIQILRSIQNREKWNLTIPGVFRGAEHKFLLHFPQFWMLLRILYGFKMFKRIRVRKQKHHCTVAVWRKKNNKR